MFPKLLMTVPSLHIFPLLNMVGWYVSKVSQKICVDAELSLEIGNLSIFNKKITLH